HGREFRDYVVNYTNAAAVISDEFRDTEDLDGFFSGWDPEGRQYDIESWMYAGMPAPPTAEEHEEGGGADRHGSHGSLTGGRPQQRDETLQHPNCVFQLLKKHFRRYTPELVEQVCGVPREQFLRVAETLCANSGRERTSAFAYAVGWTQHSVGVQYIRTAAIIPLPPGNIGRPAGGIMALRGHATIQGSTDIPTLYNILPGYIPMPAISTEAHHTLDGFLKTEKLETGIWYELPKYMVSLLTAWYGDSAQPENDFGYDYLPKIDADHSFQAMLLQMKDGIMKGLFCMGQNPAVGGQNAVLGRQALANLDWLVV